MEAAHRKESETFAHQTAVRGEEEYGDYDDDTGNGNGSHGNDDVLKRMISTHPLYSELVRVHVDCLKIGAAGETSIGHDIDHLRSQQQNIDYNNSSLRMVHQSDLDQFMEAYCMTLSKLREAMEEPQQESMAFISSMHSQLQEMKGIPIAHSNASPPPSSPGKLINESF